MTYYRTGPLANDAKKLAQIAKATIKKWNTISPVIMAFFSLGEDGLWHHRRADREMEIARVAAEKNRDKATKAAESRWGRDASSNAPSIGDEMLQASSEHSPANAPSMVSQSQSHKEQVQRQIPSDPPKGESVLVILSKKSAKSPNAKPDPRHREFREAFTAYFVHKNPTLMEAPWDGQEASQLSRFLKKNPSFTAVQWKALLNHRARSPVAHGQSLSAWIGSALNWASGPTDQFGKIATLGGSNGKPTQSQLVEHRSGYLDRLTARLGTGEDHGGRPAQARLPGAE